MTVTVFGYFFSLANFRFLLKCKAKEKKKIGGELERYIGSRKKAGRQKGVKSMFSGGNLYPIIRGTIFYSYNLAIAFYLQLFHFLFYKFRYKYDTKSIKITPIMKSIKLNGYQFIVNYNLVLFSVPSTYVHI